MVTFETPRLYGVGFSASRVVRKYPQFRQAQADGLLLQLCQLPFWKRPSAQRLVSEFQRPERSEGSVEDATRPAVLGASMTSLCKTVHTDRTADLIDPIEGMNSTGSTSDPDPTSAGSDDGEDSMLRGVQCVRPWADHSFQLSESESSGSEGHASLRSA